MRRTGGQAILFVPGLVDGMLALPPEGAAIEPSRFDHLSLLRVASSQPAQMH
jgi:hypothetical protein